MVATSHTGILTTLRRDGNPIALPVWHVVDDERIYVRTPSRSKKVARVQHDDRGSFLVEAGEAWVELTAVVVPVRAEIVHDADEIARTGELHDAKYQAFMKPASEMPESARRAYAGMTVIRLEPTGKLLTWNNAAL